jgi:hypothetical protein
MAYTKETEVTHVQTMADGQLIVEEVDVFVDSVSGERSQGINRRRRRINVGDDVTAEPQLVKDVAKGVHTVARANKRAAAKQAQADALAVSNDVIPPEAPAP